MPSFQDVFYTPSMIVNNRLGQVFPLSESGTAAYRIESPLRRGGSYTITSYNIDTNRVGNIWTYSLSRTLRLGDGTDRLVQGTVTINIGTDNRITVLSYNDENIINELRSHGHTFELFCLGPQAAAEIPPGTPPPSTGGGTPPGVPLPAGSYDGR